MNLRIDRRGFLKKAGVGTVALGTLPLADGVGAWAGDEKKARFDVVALSAAGPPPSAGHAQHRVLLHGCGTFESDEAEGGGAFAHFLFPGSNPPPGGSPLPLIASGTWKADGRADFRSIGNYGVLGAGILEMDIVLLRETPSEAELPARLRIVCNIGAAGLDTGHAEGFTLGIPGTPFAPRGEIGPFRPVTGLTLFAAGGETD